MLGINLRRKFHLGLMMLVLVSSVAILITAVFEPKNDCVLQRLQSTEAVINIGRGGLLTDNGYLVSECFMVVFRVTPIRPEQLIDRSGYRGQVTIISRQNQQIIAPSHSTLVRYQLFADCQEAIATARRFSAFLSENGFYTFDSRLLTSNRSCPQPVG